jgi:hypothetical protein
MTLLIFSNSGDWERDNIGFRTIINPETDQTWAKGPTALIQEFIRDDGVLDEYYEDEHKGLEVKQVGATMEFYDIMDMGQYTLWSDCPIDPCYFVHFSNSNGEWIYVIYSLKG